MTDAIDFQSYAISSETGFAAELAESLPEEFSPWHELASKVADLVTSGQMREETKKLPQLDSSTITDYDDLRLAHLQLAIIAMGYVWQDEQIQSCLPANVAVPLCDVADRLGLPAAACHHWFAVNWRRIDPKGPYEKSNIRIRYNLLGGEQFVLFAKLNVFIEIAFAKLMPIMQELLAAAKDKNEESVISGLNKVAEWTRDLAAESKNFQAMDATTFFSVIVHLVRGFNASNGYPEGMTYEGVKNRPKRIVMDVSAAQACVIPSLHSLLRLPIPEGTAKWYKQIRDTTWLQKSRDYYDALESHPGNVRQMAEASPAVKKAYNNAHDALMVFRNYHIELVTKFALIPSIKAKQEHDDGTPNPVKGLIKVLKGIRDEVRDTKL